MRWSVCKLLAQCALGPWLVGSVAGTVHQVRAATTLIGCRCGAHHLMVAFVSVKNLQKGRRSGKLIYFGLKLVTNGGTVAGRETAGAKRNSES